MRVPLAWALLLSIAASTAMAADLPEIDRRGTLRVLAVVSPQETYFISPTPPGGFDWELLEGFARLHHLKLSLVPLAAWDELIPALLEGRGDLIAGGFTDTPTRRERIDFTLEVFPTRSVVLTRKPHPRVATLAGLKSERIGVPKGTFMLDDLAAAGIARAQVDDSIPTGGIPKALKTGRITAGVDGIEAALTARARDRQLQIGVFLGRPASLAYGVRKQDGKLRTALDEYVQNVRRTATWSRLAIKYFGASAPEILKQARGE